MSGRILMGVEGERRKESYTKTADKTILNFIQN